MNKKRIILISCLTSALVVTGVGTYFITHFIERKIADDEKAKYAKALFELHYNDRVNLFREENKHIKNIDVAFLGDSLTEGYDVNAYYPSLNVVNRGIGGDTTFGLENRLKESAYDASPKVISMLIGANNFTTMLDNYESIVQKLKQNLPETKVILCSLTSMTGEWGRNNEIAKKNNIKIQEYANKYGYVYADLYNALLDPNTNALKNSYSLDGGHLTNEGYQVVTSVLSPIINELLL